MPIGHPNAPVAIDRRTARRRRTYAGAATLALAFALGAHAAALASPQPARAQVNGVNPTTTGSRPAAAAKVAPPKNTWIALGGDPLALALKKARRFAACVRRHGIPNLPNPRVVRNDVLILLPPGLDRTKARVKSALRACESLLLDKNGPGSTGESR